MSLLKRPGAAILLTAILLLDLSAARAAGIPGTLDPATGAFHPTIVRKVSPETTALGGELIATFTIDVASSIPTSTTINCLLSATEFTASEAYYTESATALATRSGSKATCVVTLPYSWIGAKTSDTVSLAGSIVTSTGSRIWDHGLPSITVPADGTHTHIAVAATI